MVSSSKRFSSSGNAETRRSRRRIGDDRLLDASTWDMILDPRPSRYTQRFAKLTRPGPAFIVSPTMTRPRRGESLSLTIDDLAFGGEGVGRSDGYVIFVRGGIPGDRVHVRMDQARARFGRGVIESVETPSPARVEAPCPYFGRCGGCRLQHVAYSAQLAFKTKQVADVLERLGEVTGFELRPIIGAPEIYGYRNKMEFTVSRASRA